MEQNNAPKNDISKIIAIIAFFVILGVGFIVGFILPLRPKVSESEQRLLTEFPDASFKDIASGKYFSDIALWYSDSYPGRETLLTLNDKVKNLYGIQAGPQVIGTSQSADEIPDIIPENDTEKETESSVIEEVATTTPESVSNNDASDIENTVSDNDIDAVPDSVSDNAISEETDSTTDDEIVISEEDVVDPPTSTKMEAEIKQHIQKSLYVKDGAAHALYYFSNKACERYTSIIEDAAVTLDGIANVYNILVPNSSCILPEDESGALGGSNQAQAVHYYYSLYDKAHGVESVDVLKEHSDEYLFFRTDHHWTARGAYYVYRNFCALKGWTPHELDYYTEVTFEPFLGSYYSSLRRSDMAANPDSITAYIPKGTNNMTYYDKSGRAVDYQVIHDVSKWSAATKYNCFIGGDQPMQKITNPMLFRQKHNSCLVIKESYGNCFVPFLVDHYNTVYVMDYRYCNKNVIQFVKKYGIDDVIVINNISIIGSGGVMSKLDKMLSE